MCEYPVLKEGDFPHTDREVDRHRQTDTETQTQHRCTHSGGWPGEDRASEFVNEIDEPPTLQKVV